MWGTLPEVFDRVCLYYADKTAILDRDRSLTYRQMQRRANQVAWGLGALGVAPGERVGLLLPNVLEFIPTQHGIWKAGAVAVQMPTRASAATHRAHLEQAAATTLIYHADFDDVAGELAAGLPNLKTVIRLRAPGASAGASAGRDGQQEEPGPADYPASVDYAGCFAVQPDTAPPVAVHEDDEAYILFTSGSTGEPKGVINSHFTWAHYSITAGLEIADTRPGEVFAHGAPLTHFTQVFVMPTFLRGGTNVMLPGLEINGLLDAIERYRVTATAVVPTVIYLLLDHPHRAGADLSSLRTMIYAGSPIAPDRLKEALDTLGPIFVQTYAGTEPGYVSCLRKEDHRVGDDTDRKRLASAGRPIPYVKVAVTDEHDQPLPVGEIGEICSRQLGQLLGYLDKARTHEVLRDGWVHTGDIGYLDSDGFLYIVDRKREMVVSGGFNVFPRQVEDALLADPVVAQAAVIGVPHPKWGEAVHAVVVVRDGATATAEGLIAGVKQKLGSVSAPKTIDFAATLPVNPSGKVDKRALRAPFWSGRDREVS
jgi:acyl-CoA synthetase (AMP-forming)/AMP-acid ligase II